MSVFGGTISSPVPLEPAARAWFARMVVVDLLLFALALGLILLAELGAVETAHPDLLLAGDTTLTERFNHMKWVLVTATMLLIFWRTRLSAFLALAIFYGMILIDDAGRLHERGAARLAPHVRALGDVGISSHQAGELLVWAGIGLLLLPGLVMAALRTPRHVWQDFVPLGLAFLGLLFAAVVVDAGHDLLAMRIRAAGYDMPFALWLGLVTIENIGEAIFASLTAAIAISLALRYRSRPASSQS
jgi:hypothetical protein